MAMTWRQRQAAATKVQIVASARRLFVERGYSATTIEAIAADAGVAVPTVYKAFGNKRTIALQLNELIDTESGVGALAERVFASTDPHEIVALSVRIGRNLHEHAGDIIAVVDAAANSDPELAAVVKEGMRRQAVGVRGAVALLKRLGAIPADLETNRAAGLLGQLSSAETFRTLINEHGWTIDQCEDWLTDAARRLILSGAPTSARQRPATPQP